MIAALYVAEKGTYTGLSGIDPWPESRDARNYLGPWPVVAHPPCTRWCQLAYVVQARWGHKVGDDGGCFYHALFCVKAFGGVLEHPAFSIAWPTYNLPRPTLGTWSRGSSGEWVTEVHQSAYGHRARKATWLYYIGKHPPPALDWSTPLGTHMVSYMINNGGDKPRLSKKEASATPPAFRDLLLWLAWYSRQG